MQEIQGDEQERRQDVPGRVRAGEHSFDAARTLQRLEGRAAAPDEERQRDGLEHALPLLVRRDPPVDDEEQQRGEHAALDHDEARPRGIMLHSRVVHPGARDHPADQGDQDEREHGTRQAERRNPQTRAREGEDHGEAHQDGLGIQAGDGPARDPGNQRVEDDERTDPELGARRQQHEHDARGAEQQDVNDRHGVSSLRAGSRSKRTSPPRRERPGPRARSARRGARAA